MTQAHPKLLLVEDSRTMARMFAQQLKSDGFSVQEAYSRAEAEDFDLDQFDVVLLDLNLPDGNGMEMMSHWLSQGVTIPIIVITANASINLAVDAIKAGAFDFLVKPFDAGRLTTTVRNALEVLKLRNTVKVLRDSSGKADFCGFVGKSPAMKSVYEIIENASGSRATVFIGGESGTGKELAARAVHDQSDRADKPFIAINCGAIPHELMESELFGHVKGAFTGASSDRAGVAEQADGGTLFLDEICEMDLMLQTKLLRFIQLGVFQRVGGSETKEANIRFIAATNKDPLECVRNGTFREDLYYRLHVIPITLPSLRNRARDALRIAKHFLSSFSVEEEKAFQGFDAEAESLLLSYQWPGNVRELENVIRNVVVLNNGEHVTSDMMRPLLKMSSAIEIKDDQVASSAQPLEGNETTLPLWVTEKMAIEQAITKAHGNIQKAAQLLEISPSTIYRKRETWKQASA